MRPRTINLPDIAQLMRQRAGIIAEVLCCPTRQLWLSACLQCLEGTRCTGGGWGRVKAGLPPPRVLFLLFSGFLQDPRRVLTGPEAIRDLCLPSSQPLIVLLIKDASKNCPAASLRPRAAPSGEAAADSWAPGTRRPLGPGRGQLGRRQSRGEGSRPGEDWAGPPPGGRCSGRSPPALRAVPS